MGRNLERVFPPTHPNPIPIPPSLLNATHLWEQNIVVDDKEVLVAHGLEVGVGPVPCERHPAHFCQHPIQPSSVEHMVVVEEVVAYNTRTNIR